MVQQQRADGKHQNERTREEPIIEMQVANPSHTHPTGFGKKNGWKLEGNLPHGR
jgi:hypothetical protein